MPVSLRWLLCLLLPAPLWGGPHRPPIDVHPRLVPLEEAVRQGAVITVTGLPFVNESQYECRWSTFYWPRATVPSTVVNGTLRCVLPKQDPIARDPKPTLTPLPPFPGQPDHTLGGSGRLTVHQHSANRLRWRATRIVSEETIFFVRGSLHPGDDSDAVETKRRAAEWLQSYVHRLQNPPDCGAARVTVVRRLHVAGLGCQLLMLAALLLRSVAQGTVLLLAFEWNYARGLQPPTWQALFQPLSHCDAVFFPNSSRLTIPKANVAASVQAKYEAKYFFPAADWHQGLPEEFAKFGYSWVIGQLLRYLVRPVARIARYVEEAERRLVPRRPFLCVSLRQGERGTSLRKLTPHRMPRWEAVEVLELLHAAAAVTRASVLLVSDNAALVAQVVGQGRREGLPVVPVGDFGRRRPTDGNDCLREEQWVGCSTSKEDARVLVLVDFMLLTRCRHFIGTLSSGFSRTAFLINAAHFHNASVGVSVE